MILKGNLSTNLNTDLLPSVLAETNSPNVSERYKHIQTSDVLDALAGQGFHLVSQQGKKTDIHGKHGLLLVNREIGFLDNTFSENYATVSLFNSHNGKSAVTLVSGFFRQICSNGMIAGNSDQWLKIRHSQKGFDLIGSTVDELPNRIAAFRDTIVKLQHTQLNDEQKLTIAQNVFEVLNNQRPIANAETLLTRRRVEDTRDDAYTFVNVLQENVIKGGMLSANSNRRLRPVTRLNSQNKLTGLIINTVEQFVDKLNVA